MTEKILKLLGTIFRVLPHFRGKYRIGLFLQKILTKGSGFSSPTLFVKMKDDFKVFIDLRSKTHKAAFWCGQYDTPLIKKFKSLFKEKWVILDIGANVGYYTFCSKNETT